MNTPEPAQSPVHPPTCCEGHFYAGMGQCEQPQVCNYRIEAWFVDQGHRLALCNRPNGHEGNHKYTPESGQ